MIKKNSSGPFAANAASRTHPAPAGFIGAPDRDRNHEPPRGRQAGRFPAKGFQKNRTRKKNRFAKSGRPHPLFLKDRARRKAGALFAGKGSVPISKDRPKEDRVQSGHSFSGLSFHAAYAGFSETADSDEADDHPGLNPFTMGPYGKMPPSLDPDSCGKPFDIGKNKAHNSIL
jgi:hypothetical protein